MQDNKKVKFNENTIKRNLEIQNCYLPNIEIENNLVRNYNIERDVNINFNKYVSNSFKGNAEFKGPINEELDIRKGISSRLEKKESLDISKYQVDREKIFKRITCNVFPNKQGIDTRNIDKKYSE